MPTLDFTYTIEALSLEIDCTAAFSIFLEKDGPKAGKNIEIESVTAKYQGELVFIDQVMLRGGLGSPEWVTLGQVLEQEAYTKAEQWTSDNE
jgi:hypothetical protein